MKLLVTAAVVALVLSVTFVAQANAAPAVPPNATTTTNVCIVYSVDGVSSGGVDVMYPESVSYRSNGNDGAFIWLPTGERIKADSGSLEVTPISSPEECVGILVVF